MMLALLTLGAAAPPPPPINCYESMCADAGYPCFTPNCNEWNASHVPNGDFTNTCGPVYAASHARATLATKLRHLARLTTATPLRSTSWATCSEMNNSFAKGQCKYNWDYRVCDELTCLHGSFDKCNELCTKMVKVADRGAYQLDCTNACHCWCDDPQSTYCRDGTYTELHRQLRDA